MSCGEIPITAPGSPQAVAWSGWGTALKPAYEPIILARKPLIGSVAANVLQHGTGGINIDACRIGTDEDTARQSGVNRGGNDAGRHPANVIHDTHPDHPFPSLTARFFYGAKASRADRNGSRHPTVKPIDLIAYLQRLITPPGGTILEPFGGSGTGIAAAQRNGMRIIAIERDPWYFLDMTDRLR